MWDGFYMQKRVAHPPALAGGGFSYFFQMPKIVLDLLLSYFDMIPNIIRTKNSINKL